MGRNRSWRDVGRGVWETATDPIGKTVYDSVTGRDAQLGGRGGVYDRVTPGGSTGPVREQYTNPAGVSGLSDIETTGKWGVKPHVEQVGRYVQDRWSIPDSKVVNQHGGYLPGDQGSRSLDFFVDRQTGDEIASFFTGNFRGISLDYFMWQNEQWKASTRRFEPQTPPFLGTGDVHHRRHVHFTGTSRPGERFGEVGGVQGAASDAADELGAITGWLGENLWKLIARGIAQGFSSVFKVFFYYVILYPADKLGGFFYELYKILADKADPANRGGGGVFSETNMNRFWLACFVGTSYYIAFADGGNGQGKLQSLLNRAGGLAGGLGAGRLASRRGAGRGRQIPGRMRATVQGNVSEGDTRRRRATFAATTQSLGGDGNGGRGGPGTGANRGGDGGGAGGGNAGRGRTGSGRPTKPRAGTGEYETRRV